MRHIKTSDLQGICTYFTEADPVGQRLYHVSARDLESKLRLWLLLSDGLLIAGSHLLSSPVTYNLVEEHGLLLMKGAVVPYLRAGCSSFKEYLQLKLHEQDPDFLSQPRSTLEHRARFLDHAVARAIDWEPEPAIRSFQQSLVTALMDKESPLRSKLNSSADGDLQRLAWDIGTSDFVSRGVVSELASRHLGNASNPVIEHANFLYYLWGAAHTDSEPVMHPQAFAWGSQQLANTVSRLMRTDELSTFQQLLVEFGLARDLLDRLSWTDLLDLRSGSAATEFRAKWHQLVKDARSGRDLLASTEQVLEAHHELLATVKEAVAREKQLAGRYGTSRTILQVGSGVTSGFATLFGGPGVGIASGLLSLAAIDPVLSFVQGTIGGLEITLFCTRLRKMVGGV